METEVETEAVVAMPAVRVVALLRKPVLRLPQLRPRLLPQLLQSLRHRLLRRNPTGWCTLKRKARIVPAPSFVTLSMARWTISVWPIA